VAVKVQLLALLETTRSLEFVALCAKVRVAVTGLVSDGFPVHETVSVTAVGVHVPSNAPRSGPALLLLEQPARAITRAAPTKVTELRIIDLPSSTGFAAEIPRLGSRGYVFGS
jgi:hypothetical protein